MVAFVIYYVHIYDKIHAIGILIFPTLFNIISIYNKRKYILLVISLHHFTTYIGHVTQ